MIAACFCYTVIGIVVGSIFALLFINFDKSWKKIVSFIFGMGGSSGLIVVCKNYFEIKNQNMKFWTTTCLCVSLMISFIILMMVMCKLIKDKDDNDILRIRDILLGQKSYIDKYYEMRCNEIDQKLNIKELEKREQEITKRENSIENKESYLTQELKKLEQLGNKKLKIYLPEKANIIITNEFLKIMPSYIRDLSKCINDIEKFTEQFIDENENITIKEITAYLMFICLSISEYIFGGRSQDVRTHFRKFDDKTKSYEKIISIIGNNVSNRKMTSIPYSNSMIERSDICKRALIKSINSDYDFSSNNNTVWKDYMTFSFYGMRYNNFPILSFGISVKNEERFKQQFYFLNYFRIEECLEDNLEKINEAFNLEKIFYNKEER